MAGVALGQAGVVELDIGTPSPGAVAVRALAGPVTRRGTMAAGAIIRAIVRVTHLSRTPPICGVAARTLVVVVIIRGR